MARYDLQNLGDRTLPLRLVLAVRPFQVNPPSQFLSTVGGATTIRDVAWDGATLWLHTSCGDFAFECRRRAPARAVETSGDGALEVRASINGRVVETVVQPGTSVARGDRLVVLEAMKMEHEVRAARTSVVAEVLVRAGDQVAPGQVLVRYSGEP